jgi:hypothetical protein
MQRGWGHGGWHQAATTSAVGGGGVGAVALAVEHVHLTSCVSCVSELHAARLVGEEGRGMWHWQGNRTIRSLILPLPPLQGRASSAWRQLGAVLLCVTGTEALYADMGHFSAAAIRASSCLAG